MEKNVNRVSFVIGFLGLIVFEIGVLNSNTNAVGSGATLFGLSLLFFLKTLADKKGN